MEESFTKFSKGATSLPVKLIPRTGLIESALSMAEQRVLILGTDIQSLWLLSAASCFVESNEDPVSSAICKKRITDSIIALITKMCVTQQNRNLGFAFSDAYLARHVLQIQQICDEVGLLSDGDMFLGRPSRIAEDGLASPTSGV